MPVDEMGCVGQMQRSSRNRIQCTSTWKAKYQLESRDKAISTRYAKVVHQDTGWKLVTPGEGVDGLWWHRDHSWGQRWLSLCPTIGGADCWAAEQEREHSEPQLSKRRGFATGECNSLAAGE